MTILVAEDDTYLRGLIVRLLTRNDLVIFDDQGYPMRHQVLVASDGLSALESATRCSHAVDLLITDIRMRERDGISLSENLRRRYPELAVLFTTAYIDEFLSYPALYERRAKVLIKPFTKRRLFAAIEQLLSVKVRPPLWS